MEAELEVARLEFLKNQKATLWLLLKGIRSRQFLLRETRVAVLRWLEAHPETRAQTAAWAAAVLEDPFDHLAPLLAEEIHLKASGQSHLPIRIGENDVKVLSRKVAPVVRRDLATRGSLPNTCPTQAQGMLFEP